MPADDPQLPELPPLDPAAFRLLADLVDGRLDGPQETAARTDAERLLDSSSDARATERWLRALGEVTERIPLAPRSPLVEQRLRLYFARWSHAQHVLTQPVPRFLATVIADSRRDPAPVGVRGHGECVSLLYCCDLGELALEVRSAGLDTISVDGQLLLDSDTDSPFFGVRAVSKDLHKTTETDDLGRFYFQSLPALPMTLRLDNGEFEIAARVDLGPL